MERLEYARKDLAKDCIVQWHLSPTSVGGFHSSYQNLFARNYEIINRLGIKVLILS